MRIAFKSKYKFSYLQLLYEATSKAKTPFFRVDSSAIQVIEDPLDFYLHLNTSASHSSHRIGLSSLYLGTGTLERHLLSTITKRHKLCPDLMSAMAFDYHRSKRQENGESPVDILQRFKEQVGDKTQIGFVKVGKGKGVFGQILGVHHQKIYIFDDRVILGGANLSKNYFLNRRDRYLSIHSRELSDYLFDYVQILSEISEKRLDTHYKLWKYAHMPSQYCQHFHQQLAKIKNNEAQKQQERSRTFSWQQKQQKGIVASRNQRISIDIGSSLTKFQPLPEPIFRKVREQVRQKLFNIKTQDYVGSELEELRDPLSQSPVLAGKEVYLFPLIQWPRLAEKQESHLFEALLLAAARQGHKIRLSSGYLNLNRTFFTKLSPYLKSGGVELLCSAPTANSFYRGGGLKNYIPHMYRCYEENFLSDLGEKVTIKEFENNQWSFHAKGIWLEEAENSFVTSVGSSNFNQRSKDRDSEFQLYIYSGCSMLNHRLNQQWKTLEKDCKPITLKQIQQDDDIRLSWPIRKFSRVLSSLL